MSDLIAALQPIISRVRTDVTAAKNNGKVWRTDEALTEELLKQHLEGGHARGVYLIKEGSSDTKIAVLDLDSHKGESSWDEMTDVASKVIEEFKKWGIIATAFRSSGGKGIHLIFLWDEPQDAYSVRQFFKSTLASLGYRDGAGGVASGQIEIFPKQDSVPIGKFGNQFFLPLAGQSVPLAPAFDLDLMNREHVTKLRWLTSSPVPKAEKTPLNQKKDAPALRQRKPIGDLSNLINFDTLAAALKYIPNDLPYDEFIKMTAALKSACAGSESFYPIYEEWALQWPDNTPESVREKWDSIHDTSAGAGTIFHYAQKRGWVPPDGITPPWVLEMNEHYFVVKDAGKTVIYSEEWDPIAERQRLVPSSFEDIRNLHKNEKVLVGEKNVPRGHAWIDHAKRRTYHGGIVFAPNKMVKPDQYNLWRGYGVEAQKGQWELMRKHIRYVICDGDETKFRYLLGWMANAIQHPDEPGRVAIVLQGGQGTGKGFFAKYFGKLFGQHTIHVSCADHVTGRFNGHLRDAVLVFVDEAFFAGDKQIKNKMKALITEETLMLEDKYMKAQSIPNHMHFIIASNERHVMNVEADDRRHFILQVSDKVKNDRAYFAALRQEMENGGPEAMLFDLLEMDLAEFDVTTAPKTEALLEQKIKSLYGPPAWLHNCLYMGEMAGQSWDERGVIIPRISAHKDYTDKHRQVGDLRTSRDQSEFGAEVHKIFGNALKEKRLTQGLQRVWCHAFPPLSEARRLFEHFIGGKISWPHDDNIDPLT